MGFAIFIGYVVVIGGIQKFSGVPYPEFGTSAENVFRTAVLSLGVAGILLAITTTLLGWWKSALFEQQRSRHKWPIFVPVIMLLAAVVNLAYTDWSKIDALFLFAILLLGIFVGFCEEMVTRGLLVVALRSKLSEVLVWLISSATFGLMHLINVFLGADFGGTFMQVLLAFGGGTAFYILRRTTGSLILAMLLHAVWDISVFTSSFASTGTSPASLAPILILIAGVAVVWSVFKGVEPKHATEIKRVSAQH
ncbi:hypothetical protein AL755_18060 [Arthrobacter sp. ERGS1:01]|nr:hypothetical protein AL755_18060 [Arthrobacter sp. ERGS1:01]